MVSYYNLKAQGKPLAEISEWLDSYTRKSPRFETLRYNNNDDDNNTTTTTTTTTNNNNNNNLYL